MNSIVSHLPEIIIQLVALALAVSVHESAHGLAAERLGDPTARWLGRISLNPIKHVDLVGTVLFPLMLALVGAPLFGWAKPVPYVPRNLRDQKWGPGLVALAGPASNVAMAIVAIVILLVLKAVVPDFRPLLGTILRYGAGAAPGIVAPLVYLVFAVALINVILAVFNLVPIPPLDGSHLLEWVLPPQWRQGYAQVGRYGFLIIMALFWFGGLGKIFVPFYLLLQWILFS